MARKPRETAAPDVSATAHAATSASSEPIASGPPEASSEHSLAATSDANHAEESPASAFPEPMTEQVVNLADEFDGPKIRLQRSGRYRQMRIVIDEKPDAIYLDMLRNAGMKWRNQDKAWSIQLDREAAWRTALDVERLFYDIANGIRQDRGLSPVLEFGR